jgi:nucleotide-binding universal stress UspA family protein
MASIKHIVVPTDFSEPADAALTYGIELARQLGATVSLVHVFEDPTVAVFSDQYVPFPPEVRGELLADVRRRLADEIARRGYSEMTPVVLVGQTARAIVETARERHADLIVMGTHGRHGMAHLLLGSVAERVVRTAPCPVLTVRPPEAHVRAAEPVRTFEWAGTVVV